MRTGPYKYRCCFHCSHAKVMNGHSVPCGDWACLGSWPRLRYFAWRLIHPTRTW